MEILKVFFCSQRQTKRVRRRSNPSSRWRERAGKGKTIVRDDPAAANGARAVVGAAGACQGKV